MIKSKYFIKVLAVYMIVFGIFTIIFVGVYNKSRQETYRDQFFAESISDFEQIKKESDNTLSGIMILCKLMMEYDCVKKFSMDAGNYYSIDFENVTDIERRLMKNQNSFSNVGLNMAIMNSADNLIISSSGTINDRLMKKSFGVSVDNVRELFAQNDKEGYDYCVIPNTNNNGKFIIAHQTIYSNGRRVYMLTEFERENIKLVKSGINDIYVVCPTNISRENIDMFAEKIDEEEKFLKNEIRRKGNKNKYILFGQSELIPEIMYLADYEVSVDKKFILFISAIVFLALITEFAISYLIAQYTYKPIKKILNLFDDVDGDEMEFIMNETKRTLEKNEYLAKIVDEKNESLRNRFLFDVFNGFVFGENIKQGFEDFNMEFLLEDCRCVIFEYLYGMSSGELHSEDANVKIHNCITEKMCKFPAVSVAMQNGRTVVITKNYDMIRQNILDIIVNIKRDFDIRVYAALGECVGSVIKIKNSYDDLIIALENKFAVGDKDIITQEDIRGILKKDYYYPLEDEKMIIDYIMSGQKEKAMLILDNILKRNIFEVALSHKSMMEFKFGIVATAKRLINKINKTEDEIFENGTVIYLELNMCKEGTETAEYIIQMFSKIADAAAEGKSQQSDIICDKILEYINENLSKDISMNDISVEFGMSISNIGKRLRDKYNINFKSYINERRIEKAKEIMRENKNIKIKDLAPMIGFNSSVSFIRCFKNIEGISPRQYIEMNNMT